MRAFVLGSGPLDIASDPRLTMWRVPHASENAPALAATRNGPCFYVQSPIADEQTWADAFAWHEMMGHRAVLLAPLLAGERWLGFVGFSFGEPISLAPERIELAQALANQTALALELRRLADEGRQAAIAREQERAAQEKAAELTKANAALSRSFGRISSNGELSTFLDGILQEAVAASGAASASIFLYHQNSDCFRHSNHNIRGEVIDVMADERVALFRQPIPASTGPAWSISQHQKEIFWTDYHHLERSELPGAKEYHRQLGYRYVATVPMLQNDEVIGFFGLAYDRSVITPPANFGLEVCRTLANQAALAVKLTRLAEQAKLAAIAGQQQKATQERMAQLSRSNTVLQRSVDRLPAQTDLSAFLRGALEETFVVSGASCGAIFRYDSATDHWAFADVVIRGENSMQWREDQRFSHLLSPVPAGLVHPPLDRIFEKQVLWPDADYPNPQDWPDGAEWQRRMGYRKAAVLRLRVGDQKLGFLGLSFLRDTEPEESGVEQCVARATGSTRRLPDRTGRRRPPHGGADSDHIRARPPCVGDPRWITAAPIDFSTLGQRAQNLSRDFRRCE